MHRQRGLRRHAVAAVLGFAFGAVACGDSNLTTLQAPDSATLSRGGKKSAPSSPTSVAAVAGDAQATVTWVAPSNNGGGIQAYIVTSSPGVATDTVSGSALSAVVPGLTDGTTYTFTVAATNRYGSSPASNPSNAVTPTATVVSAPAPSGHWLSGYYMGYLRDVYPETSVNFGLMTHVIMGAIEATSTGGVTTDFFIDNVNGPLVAKTISSRAHSVGRKAILMLGGQDFRTNLYTSTTDTYRATFVANLLSTLDNLGYDGIDVDWEPLYDTDKPQVLQFLKDLRAARPSIILTYPVGWQNANWGPMDTWYAQLAGVVDQINIMTYDMAGIWGGWVSWHFGALTGEQPSYPSDVQSTVAAYTGAGVSAAKLGIGMGFFGSCWRGVTGPRQTIPSTASMGNSDNSMAYYTIMSSYYNSSAYNYDTAAQVPYLSFSSPTGPQSCNFVSYEDSTSIAAKGAWLVAHGVGGAMMWNIQEGHLPDGTDPLMSSAYKSIFGTP